jgi:hypothetical protein
VIEDALARIVVGLNTAANSLGRAVLFPIGVLPGWLSATLVSLASGLFLLVVFKYTSNQRAIKGVRDDVNANLLALRLYKDSAQVALKAQGRVLWGALRLFVLALVPMLVMTVPVILLLGQLALWYQQRPLQVGEEAVVSLKLSDVAPTIPSKPPRAALPGVKLKPSDAFEVTVGPVRVLSQREVCWNIKAVKKGQHRLEFLVGTISAAKSLAVDERFMRTSPTRPGWRWYDIVLYPDEQPFGPDSPIQSIGIDYPKRPGLTSGTDWWVVYWFIASMAGAFGFKGLLHVNV